MKNFRLLNITAVLIFIIIAFSAYGENSDNVSGATDTSGIRFNFRGADVNTVLDYLSKSAGFVIIREADVRGTVDVVSHQPLDKTEAVQLINTILNEKGYAAIRNERTLRIVSIDEAKKRNVPVKTGADPELIPSTDEIVTQIIPVRYVKASELVETLKPLISTHSTLSANESSNALVLTDTQVNIKRIVEIVRALDTSVSSISDVRVFILSYSDATEVAKMIEEIFKSEETTSGNGRSNRMERFFGRMRGGPDTSESNDADSAALQASSRVVAVADERTNSLVVSAPEDYMPVIVQLVKEIDTAAEDITGVKIFHLEYADAEEMAELITNVFADESQTTNRRNQQQGRRRFFGGPGGGPPGFQQQQDDTSERKLQETTVKAVADTRTNSVVVTASNETLKLIEVMVKELDADPAKDKKVFVYTLENADVENVAEILKGIFQEDSTSSGSTTTGDRLGRSRSTETNTSGSTRN